MSARIGALLFVAAIFGPAILATVLLIHLRHCSDVEILEGRDGR